MLLKKDYIFIVVIILLPVLPALLFCSSVKIEVSKDENDPYRKKIIDFKDEKILWVDARSREKFEVKHVPEAILINSVHWDAGLEKLFEVFEPGQTIVVYCNKGCSESSSIAARLREALGQKNVYYLDGGMDSWFSNSQ